MYVDKVDFEDSPMLDRCVNLVFTEFVHREMQQLEDLSLCENMETDYNLWTMREHCQISNKDECWLTFADQAITMIDCKHIWLGIFSIPTLL